MRLGPISQLLSPGYAHCLKCKTTWNFVRGHSTSFTVHHGCSPLCEQCWRELTPATRLPYYRKLWAIWFEQGGEISDWPRIERAVLEGK